MDFFNQLTQIMPSSYTFNMLDIFTVLTITLLLSSIIAWTYNRTHSGISYSKSYVLNLVIMALVVACVMLIVGSNIARAFTLIGALSIVRFRNAIKDPMDVGYIFLSMAVGMACGTRFYSMAIVMTLFITSTIFLLTYIDFGSRDGGSDLLKILLSSNADLDKDIKPIIKKHVSSFHIMNISQVLENQREVNLSTTFRKESSRMNLINDLQELELIHKVELFHGESFVQI